MARRLEEKATRLDRDVAVVAQVAEDLPFPDETFDSVVSTLVLCSVSDLAGSLTEVFRVLKQDGAFYFYEHVAASTGRSRTLQRLAEPAEPAYRRRLQPETVTLPVPFERLISALLTSVSSSPQADPESSGLAS